MELQATSTMPPPVIGGGLGAVQNANGGARSAPRETSQADAQASAAPTRESVENATKKVQSFVESQNSQLSFSIDQDSGESIVKVVDRTTHQVIRQIPSQEMLDIANALDRLQGLLVNNKA